MLFKKKLKDDDIIATRKVSAEDLSEWPIVGNEAIIQKRGVLLHDKTISDKFICVTIVVNGKIFALNGASKDKYKIKHLMDGKYYKKHHSVSELIEIGLDLKQ